MESGISKYISNETVSNIIVKMIFYIYIQLSKLISVKRDARLKNIVVKKFENEKKGLQYYSNIKSKNHYFKNTFDKNKNKKDYQDAKNKEEWIFELFTKLWNDEKNKVKFFYTFLFQICDFQVKILTCFSIFVVFKIESSCCCIQQIQQL